MNSKLKVLVSVVAMSFVMVGCGGGSSSSSGGDGGTSTPASTDNPVPDISEFPKGMNPSGVTDIKGFLNKYYRSHTVKDTYETTEEFGQKREDDFAPIRGNITFLMDAGMSYDADTSTGKVYISFSNNEDFNSTVGELNYVGSSYNVFNDSSKITSGVDSVTYNNYHDYIFDNVNSEYDLGGNNWSRDYSGYTLSFRAEPNDAKNYDIGIKLSVDAYSSEIGYSKHSSGGFSLWVTKTYTYPSTFNNLIVYDKNSGKELGRLVPQ